MTTARKLMATTALACAALAPVAAAAQSADAWRFHAILYGYLPTIGGSTAFPQAGSPVSVDADTIIDDLNGAFMGTFEAERGRWGVFTDVMYVDVDGSKSQTRDISIGGSQIPADATANLDMNIKGWVWTIAASYLVLPDPRAPMQVLVGARLLDIEENLRWQTGGNVGSIPLPGRQGDVTDKGSNWDAIIGVKGRLAFGGNREWFIPYYADVGTGQSDLTWQAIAGLGYSFKWGEVLAAWRYLDYEMESDSAIQSVNFNGPAIGVGFRW